MRPRSGSWPRTWWMSHWCALTIRMITNRQPSTWSCGDTAVRREVMKTINRWYIALAGVFMQLALGAVYAWSVFRIPLARQFGWSISQVTLTFTISIFVLGIAAFFGGLWLNRQGPRIVGVTGGALYGIGVFLAAFSAHKLWWLYLSYGLIGGIGLGFAYILPVAVPG